MLVTRKIHEQLCHHNLIYQKWHNSKTSRYIHIFLLIFAISAAVNLTTNEIKVLNHVQADTYSNELKQQSNYIYKEYNEKLLTYDYLTSKFSSEGYLNLSWDSKPDIKYVSIFIIDHKNNAQKIADKIKNRKYFSAYMSGMDCNIVQIVGFDIEKKELFNGHFQI